MSLPRMTANPSRPSRYRAGKKLDVESSSEEEPELSGPNQGVEYLHRHQNQSIANSRKNVSKIHYANSEIRQDDATVVQVSRSKDKQMKQVQEVEGFETEESSSNESEEEDGENDEDSASGSESSDEDTPRVFLRPKFVRKDKRGAFSIATETKGTEQRWADEETERKTKTNEIIQEQLERNAASRAMGRRNWDYDEEEEVDAVDDTDGLHPEGELAAWKLRELTRVKREREAIEVAEKEREEIERRRNLGSEERLAEDNAFISMQKEEQTDRGRMSYMQKYFHKGAFFQNDLKEQGLDRRDIMASKFEDQTDRSQLPEYMQIRDMTKLGRKGRTKYKDMKSEDTGKWGDHERKGNRTIVDLDVRFMPDRVEGSGEFGRTGANAIRIRERADTNRTTLQREDATTTEHESTKLRNKVESRANQYTSGDTLSDLGSTPYSRSRLESSRSPASHHDRYQVREPAKRNLSPALYLENDKKRRL